MLSMLRALLLLFLLYTTVAAADSSRLQITDPWIRAAPPSASVMAGYLTLTNDSDTDIVIDRVESNDFGAIEIHEMSMHDGVMRMRRLATLRVPARGRVELKPGGQHLMMFRPQRTLEEGASSTVELGGKGFSRSVTLTVKSPSS